MIKMEESKQPLDFEVPHKRFCAYHCFGDKATEYLSCLKQPYEDIYNCNNNNLDPSLTGKIIFHKFSVYFEGF